MPHRSVLSAPAHVARACAADARKYARKEAEPRTQPPIVIFLAPPYGDTNEFIALRVMHQNGSEAQFKIMMTTPMKKLMDAWCRKKGYNRDSVSFYMGGERIVDDQTPNSFEMEDGDVIDVIMGQTGDIGIFGNHRETVGASFLRDDKCALATAADADAIAAVVGATNPTPFVAYPTVELVAPAARLALMNLVDARHRQLHKQTDTKLDLMMSDLEAVLGKAAVGKMVELFDSRVDEIKVRRVEAGSGEVIKFHTDFSLKVRTQSPSCCTKVPSCCTIPLFLPIPAIESIVGLLGVSITRSTMRVLSSSTALGLPVCAQ
jgi:small ubiquitin-related modifier